MPVLRTQIESALNEIISQEEGMRFQGLAVVLGKQRWPELIAHQRKKDFGLDAYAPASLTPENIGKGLAASITATLGKVSGDARRAKEDFPGLGALLFVTPVKVGNSKRRQWQEAIRKEHDLDLHIIEREEIITVMMMPENAQLCAGFLYLDIDAEPEIADLIERTRRAAASVTRTWAEKTKGHPLIELTAMRLDRKRTDSDHLLSLEQIDRELLQSGRIVLEGPAGRGKTTTLIQLAQRTRTPGTPFIVELPSWTTSRLNILEYIAGMPAFQAERLTSADLAQVQQTEPFLFLLNGWNEIGSRAPRRQTMSTPGPRAGFSVRGHYRGNAHAPFEPTVARRIAAATAAPWTQAAGGVPGSSPWRESRRTPRPHRWGSVARRADTDAVRPVGSCLAV